MTENNFIANKDALHFIRKNKEIEAFYNSFFDLYKDIGKKVENEIYQEAFLVITILTFLKHSGMPKEAKLKVIKRLKDSVESNKI